MTRILNASARYASPILLVIGALLASGAVLTGFGQTAIGWSIYGIGYVAALVAVAAVVGLQRHVIGRFGWAAFGVLFAGVILGLPKMLMVWGFYAPNSFVHGLLMPYATPAVGILAGIVTWIGLIAVAIALTRKERLPMGGAILMIAAALIALPAEIRLLPQVSWVAALVILFAALGWIAVSVRQHSRALA
jgi:hypothetical protein